MQKTRYKNKIIGHILLFAILLCSTTQSISAQGDNDKRLSGDAFASILTVGPGDVFYETFGHTAIRICDTVNKIDLVYNYGSFDFAEPHFYLKFIKGRLDYFVIDQSFESFMFEYGYFGREAWEQRLNLNHNELERLYAALVENVRPENMCYKYDFFRDNCATRVHDMVKAAMDPDRQIIINEPKEKSTYRDMVYKYTEEKMLWWRFGVDLLLGFNVDQKMSAVQTMFVPMEMMPIYDSTLLSDGTKLCQPIEHLMTDRRETMGKSASPLLCFWILFGIVALLTVMERFKGWKLYWLDGILFGLTGAVSLLILYLWIFSDHWCAKANLNILWANPMFLWLAIRVRRYNFVFNIIIGCILLTFFVGWAMWPQHFNSAVVPIASLLMVRLISRLSDTWDKLKIKN